MNPYRGLSDFHYWRRTVSDVPAHRFDPIVRTRFKVEGTAKVATAGSCFAQHIARKLTDIDFNYYVAETGAELPAAERAARQYGLFSARYGNIYTSRQLIQLAEEAFGRRQPEEIYWHNPAGRYVDPYRQTVEPNGFADLASLLADRAVHLSAVRDVLVESDVLVFTLGLTETWRSRSDNSVFPLAPGVVAGTFDPQRYDFINLGVGDVADDMTSFLDLLKDVNPKIKVILTVSPVPLIATYEDRNVLLSTTYSKSVLRVAVEALLQKYDWVDYFPSYEIITGSQSGGLYFEEDRREVNAAGVAHVMRVFVRHYVEGRAESETARAVTGRARAAQDTLGRFVICDEEIIERVNI